MDKKTAAKMIARMERLMLVVEELRADQDELKASFTKAQDEIKSLNKVIKKQNKKIQELKNEVINNQNDESDDEDIDEITEEVYIPNKEDMLKDLIEYPTKSYRLKNQIVVNEDEFEFKNINTVQPDNINDFMDLIKILLTTPKYHGKKVSVFYIFNDTAYNTSTVFTDVNRQLFIAAKKIEDVMLEYDVDIKLVKFVIKYFNGEVRGIEEASIEENNKFITISPKTRTNCIYTSCVIASNVLKGNYSILSDTKKQINNASYLKSLCSASDQQDVILNEIANKLEVNINIYDKIFNKITIDKGFDKTINIKISDNHCRALLEKEHLAEEIKNDLSQQATNEVEFKSEAKKIIKFDIDKVKKGSKTKKINRIVDERIATYDVEAYKINDSNGNKVFKAYAIGTAWFNLGLIEYKSFYGVKCIQEWIEWIASEMEFFNGYTFYAHNGGKFDVAILFNEGLVSADCKLEIDCKQSVELNNSWIGLGLKNNEGAIRFKDSFRLFSVPLAKLTKDFKVEHQKLAETVNHNDITADNWMSIPEIKKYLEHDCKGLLECMKILSNDVFNQYKVNITECYTAASLSKKIFYKHYYNHHKQPLYKPSDDEDSFIRKSYYGGRTECFKLGEVDKSYYYDFTSLYPDVSCNFLPIENATKKDFGGVMATKDMLRTIFGFIECEVRTTNRNMTPLHAYKHDNKLLFPYFEKWTKMVLFSEEIKQGINQYEYKLGESLLYKKSKLLRKFMCDAFANKAKYTAEGNKVRTGLAKLIANSGYGFFGMNVKDRDGLVITKSSNEWLGYLIDDRLSDVTTIGNYDFIRVNKDLKINDCSVGVASAITSYARIKIWKLIEAVKKTGCEVYYCDTDSIITNCDITKHNKIREEFQWDNTGIELGSLKNECLAKMQDSGCDNEFIKKQMIIDGGDLCFDRCIINGAKMYSIEKKLYNGKIISIDKCKGFAQKNFRINDKQDLLAADCGIVKETNGLLDVEYKMNIGLQCRINNGETVSQNQTQFKLSKSDYATKGEPSIKYNQINKNFKQFYSKGIIDVNKYITPLSI